jgi:hypothetical protein
MRRVILIILLLSLFFALAGSVQAVTDTIVSYPDLPGAPDPAAGIPQYIKYIFIFSLSTVGVIALIAMIIAAFQYVTSVGNPQKAAAAKDRIASALLGMLLLLGSYVLLNTINPDLLKLKVEAPAVMIEIEETESPYTGGGKCQFLSLSWQGDALYQTPKGFSVDAGETLDLVLEGTEECASKALQFYKVDIPIMQSTGGSPQTLAVISHDCPIPTPSTGMDCVEIKTTGTSRDDSLEFLGVQEIEGTNKVKFPFKYTFEQDFTKNYRYSCPREKPPICNYRQLNLKENKPGIELFYTEENSEITTRFPGEALNTQYIPRKAPVWVLDGIWLCMIEDVDGKKCNKGGWYFEGCAVTKKRCESQCEWKAKEITGNKDNYVCGVRSSPKECFQDFGCQYR